MIRQLITVINDRIPKRQCDPDVREEMRSKILMIHELLNCSGIYSFDGKLIVWVNFYHSNFVSSFDE